MFSTFVKRSPTSRVKSYFSVAVALHVSVGKHGEPLRRSSVPNRNRCECVKRNSLLDFTDKAGGVPLAPFFTPLLGLKPSRGHRTLTRERRRPVLPAVRMGVLLGSCLRVAPSVGRLPRSLDCPARFALRVGEGVGSSAPPWLRSILCLFVSPEAFK